MSVKVLNKYVVSVVVKIGKIASVIEPNTSKYLSPSLAKVYSANGKFLRWMKIVPPMIILGGVTKVASLDGRQVTGEFSGYQYSALGYIPDVELVNNSQKELILDAGVSVVTIPAGSAYRFMGSDKNGVRPGTMFVDKSGVYQRIEFESDISSIIYW